MTEPKTKDSAANQPDGGGVAAVNRALSLICCFGNDDKSLSLAELARRTGLYKSTILRLAESLEQFDILVRDTDGGFRLGHELVRLGSLAHRVSGDKMDIEAVLTQLVEETGESATYYIRRNDLRLALFRVDSRKSLRDHIRPGDLLTLRHGAAGRVLSDTRPYVERRNDPFQTIVSLGERDPEIAAIAGPVFQDGVIVGSLSISGAKTRFSEKVVQHGRRCVEQACRTLSLMLDPTLEIPGSPSRNASLPR